MDRGSARCSAVDTATKINIYTKDQNKYLI